MNKHLKVELDDASTRLVERQLETGDYESPEDVIRASLKMLDEERERIEFIRAELIKGERSGPPRAVDKHALLEQLRQETRCVWFGSLQKPRRIFATGRKLLLSHL